MLTPVEMFKTTDINTTTVHHINPGICLAHVRAPSFATVSPNYPEGDSGFSHGFPALINVGNSIISLTMPPSVPLAGTLLVSTQQQGG